MNKRIIGFMLCLFTLFFVCCIDDPDPDPDNPINIGNWFENGSPNTGGTYVKFVNNNAFAVSIYRDSARQNKLTDVPAGSQSDNIAVSPNQNGASFYTTYQIIIEGVLLPFNGNEKIARIDANRTTTVTIDSLSTLAQNDQNRALTTDAYIKIQNISSSSLTLRRLNIEQIIEGTYSPILNGGETGIFKVRPGVISDFSLRENTVEEVAFPAYMTEISAAYVYFFRFDTTLSLQRETRLTLGAAGNVTPGPDPGGGGTETNPIALTANVWNNGSITTSGGTVWYSFYVTGGTTYYIWWNDSYQGNSTKTLDIMVSASYSNGSSIFTSVDSAWNSPQSFTAASTGTVKIKVYPYQSTGTYGIVYSTSNTRPAVPAINTVTFSANNGNGTSPPAQTGLTGTTISLPNGEGLYRSGYEFGGWNTLSNGTGITYSAGSIYTITGNVTLYAKWNQWLTVSYNLNGGTSDNGTPPSVSGFSGTSIVLPDEEGLTRNGYAFGGWNTSSGGSGTNYEAGGNYTIAGTSNVTLYIKWNKILTVTFNANNGTGTAPSPELVTSGSSIILPNGDGLTRSGYQFAGWSTSSGTSGTNYTAGASYTASGTSDITLYARWNLAYTVTYDANSGYGKLPTSQTVGSGTAVSLQSGEELRRDGYVFGGWSLNVNGSGTSYNAGATYSPYQNTTMYAKWNPIYYVSFDANGGSGAAPEAVSGANITIPDGSGLSRPGFTFGGWNINQSGLSTNYTAGSTYAVAGNMTLYARWYTSSTSNSAIPLTENIWTDGNIISGLTTNIIYSFNVTAGTDYSVWWHDKDAASFGKSADISVSAYYAATGTTIFSNIDEAYGSAQQFNAATDGIVQLRVRTYNKDTYDSGTYSITYKIGASDKPQVPLTVYFDLEGGSGTIPSSQTVLTGNTITLPDGNGFSRNGFTFDGWRSSNHDNYAAGSSYPVSGSSNITFYARWNDIYVLNFSANGGGGTIPRPETSSSYGNTITLPSGEGLTRSGYIFSGWNTSANGTGTAYSGGGSYSFTNNVLVTLYAKWEVVYTLTFSSNGGDGLAPSSINGSTGTAITIPGGDGLSRGEYSFGGWNANANGTGTNYYAGSEYLLTGSNVTLYAKWNPIYTVTFNSNGGSGSVSSMQTGNTSVTLPGGGGLYRTGYVFGGWNTRADGSGSHYNSGYNYSISGNVTFYALWYTETSMANPFFLTANEWAIGNIIITSSIYDWYSFNVTEGNTYYVWWNDRNDGNYTKTANVDVSAFYGDDTLILDEVDAAWSTPQRFVANSSGTVKLKVVSYSGGTYAVAFSTSATRPN
jgi:uncharacterized repeat protein (TIGR02543 family)